VSGSVPALLSSRLRAQSSNARFWWQGIKGISIKEQDERSVWAVLSKSGVNKSPKKTKHCARQRDPACV
jgi:hypothetical protein